MIFLGFCKPINFISLMIYNYYVLYFYHKFLIELRIVLPRDTFIPWEHMNMNSTIGCRQAVNYLECFKFIPGRECRTQDGQIQKDMRQCLKKQWGKLLKGINNRKVNWLEH